jgi:hypothetical protein
MHQDLDERLFTATPPITATDPRVRHELAKLVAESERVSVRRRRPVRKWVIGGTAAALVLGGATGTFAVTGAPWGAVVKLANLTYESTLASGNTCETRLVVLPNTSDGSGTVNDLPSTVREDTVDAKVLAAQIDVGALDIESARDYLSDHDMISSGTSEDAIELLAYNQAVTDELNRLMEAEGLNPTSVSARSEVHCAEDL